MNLTSVENESSKSLSIVIDNVFAVLQESIKVTTDEQVVIHHNLLHGYLIQVKHKLHQCQKLDLWKSGLNVAVSSRLCFKEDTCSTYLKVLTLTCNILLLKGVRRTSANSEHSCCLITKAAVIEIVIELLRHYKCSLFLDLPPETLRPVKDVLSQLWEEERLNNQVQKLSSRQRHPGKIMYIEYLTYAHLLKL